MDTHRNCSSASALTCNILASERAIIHLFWHHVPAIVVLGDGLQRVLSRGNP